MIFLKKKSKTYSLRIKIKKVSDGYTYAFDDKLLLPNALKNDIAELLNNFIDNYGKSKSAISAGNAS